MVIWRGFGIVVLLALGVFGLIDNQLVAGVIAGAGLWFLGRKMNEDGPRHDLFFIPVEYWAFVALGLGIFSFATGGRGDAQAPPPNEADARAEASVEPKSEPSESGDGRLARLNYDAEAARPAPAEPIEKPVARPESPPKFAQVWADTANRTYYPDNCRKAPPNTYRVAKSAVTAQGFRAEACP